MKVRNMEERNTISYEEKEKKGSENDMEKITWASRKTTTTNKSIFFQRGEKKSNGARLLENNTKQHNNGTTFKKNSRKHSVSQRSDSMSSYT